MNRAETFNPTALLKVKITNKGVGTPDFYTVGEVKLKQQNGMETIMRWEDNDKAAVYRDKDGHWHIEWYLEGFDKGFFELNNPLTRPNWSYLVTGDITEMPLDIFWQEDESYTPQQVKSSDVEILSFEVLVKEEAGHIASYPFLDEQIINFMEGLV